MKLRTALIAIALLAVLFAWAGRELLLFRRSISYNSGPHESMLVSGQRAQIVGKSGDKVQIRTLAKDGISPTGTSLIPTETSVMVVDDVHDIDDASASREVQVRVTDGPNPGILVLVRRKYLRTK